MSSRNIPILTVCQTISATGSIVLVTLGGIIGAGLAGNPALATLPISVMVISIAATTVPAAMLMRAIGRRRGFALGSLTAAAAVLLAAWAIAAGSFAGFVVAAGLFGINMAFTPQYRFAAAESVEQRHAARAISFVLVGAIGGALLGPEIVRFGEFAVARVQYAGTLLALAVLYVVQAALFLTMRPLPGEAGQPGQLTELHGRPLSRIVRQPIFVVAVLGGTVAYGVMTLIMTATPLSMHINDGYSLDETARVIRSHVLGMYVPSLFSGWLIERVGLSRMMWAGAALLTTACLVALQRHEYVHYTWSLVLLGVGWNFLYVGGTTMLTLSYSMAERFKAQAVNEFSVFGTSATASLLAGTVMHTYGWSMVVLAPLPLLILILAGLWMVRKDRRLRRLAAARGAA